MPLLTVHLPALLADALQMHGCVVDAQTLSDAVAQLRKLHPRLATHVFDDHGKQRRHVLMFLNDQDTRYLNPPDPALQPGDRLTIVQAISGG